MTKKPKDWGAVRPEPVKKDWDKFTTELEASPRHIPTTEEIIDNRKIWDSTARSIGVVTFDN
jgi:hypothetical protein